MHCLRSNRSIVVAALREKLREITPTARQQIASAIVLVLILVAFATIFFVALRATASAFLVCRRSSPFVS